MILINLKGIKKVFYKGRTKIEVLKGVNVRFWYKGFYALIGKSGSGKSTLLKIIAGLQFPTSGTYSFNNETLDYDERKMSIFRNTKIGMVFQNYQLIERFTPLENVSFPLIIRGIDRETSEKKAYELFKKFSLENKMTANVNDLSGGEKQRIAILRAMISNPQVYLLDEPTGALDNDNAIKVMEMFLEISESNLVIMVTHNVALAKKYADKIYYLEDGVLHE